MRFGILLMLVSTLALGQGEPAGGIFPGQGSSALSYTATAASGVGVTCTSCSFSGVSYTSTAASGANAFIATLGARIVLDGSAGTGFLLKSGANIFLQNAGANVWLADNSSNLNVYGSSQAGYQLANQITLAGSTATNPVTLTATGSDTNIGINLISKGTSGVTATVGGYRVFGPTTGATVTIPSNTFVALDGTALGGTPSFGFRYNVAGGTVLFTGAFEATGAVFFDAAVTFSGLVTGNKLLAGSWAAEVIGTATNGASFTGAYQSTAVVGTMDRISCSSGVAGAVSGNLVAHVQNITDGTTLCTCTLGACTTAANIPLSCSCATAFLAAKNYTLVVDATSNCGTYPQNIICNVSMTQ